MSVGNFPINQLDRRVELWSAANQLRGSVSVSSRRAWYHGCIDCGG
jgi:hypothetical protein